MTRARLIRTGAFLAAVNAAAACSGADELDVEVLYSRKVNGGQTSFEVIDRDDRLSEVIDSLGTTDVGGPSPTDGPPWHPPVDFEKHVVVFVNLALSCSTDIKRIRAVETDVQVQVEVTSRIPGCGGLTVVCSSYAFVQMPRLPKQYVLTTKDTSPKCN